jgi:hypothetical protein
MSYKLNDVIDSDLRVSTAELIRNVDAVLVGAGSELSSAAGYNYYHYNTVFQKNFHDFEEAYGIQSLFQGFYYIYSKPEQQWKS